MSIGQFDVSNSSVEIPSFQMSVSFQTNQHSYMKIQVLFKPTVQFNFKHVLKQTWLFSLKYFTKYLLYVTTLLLVTLQLLQWCTKVFSLEGIQNDLNYKRQHHELTIQNHMQIQTSLALNRPAFLSLPKAGITGRGKPTHSTFVCSFYARHIGSKVVSYLSFNFHFPSNKLAQHCYYW